MNGVSVAVETEKGPSFLSSLTKGIKRVYFAAILDPILFLLKYVGLTPNWVTVIRVVIVIPSFFAWAYALQHNAADLFWLANVILWVSYYGDHLDGALARKYDEQSPLGKIIDPTGDKFTHFIGLSCLIFYADFLFIILVAPQIFSEYKNLKVGWLKYDVEMGINKDFKIDENKTGSNLWGKVKMVLQCTGMILMMLCTPQNHQWFLPWELPYFQIGEAIFLGAYPFSLKSRKVHESALTPV